MYFCAFKKCLIELSLQYFATCQLKYIIFYFWTPFQILANPYEDIIPRVGKKKKDGEGEKRPKSKSKATK